MSLIQSLKNKTIIEQIKLFMTFLFNISKLYLNTVKNLEH